MFNDRYVENSDAGTNTNGFCTLIGRRTDADATTLHRTDVNTTYSDVICLLGWIWFLPFAHAGRFLSMLSVLHTRWFLHSDLCFWEKWYSVYMQKIMSLMASFCALLFPTRCLGWDLGRNWFSFWGISYLLWSDCTNAQAELRLIFTNMTTTHTRLIFQ